MMERKLKNYLRLLETLVDTIPSPVFYKDTKGIYLGCNEAFANQILGLTKDKIVGCSLFELPDAIPADLALVYHQKDLELINNPGTQFYEHQVQCADGCRRDFFFYKATYTDGNDNIAGMIGVMIDITDRKRAEEELRESEKRYRLLFESAGDAIFIVEAEGEKLGDIVEANLAAAEMHGYTIDELLKLNLIKDLDAPDAAKDAPARAKRILNGEWIKAEIKHLKKDGSEFPVEISCGLLEFMGRKYILAIDRDITERKRTEEALLRAEQMRLVGEWATGFAQEIKNSLAGIRVSVEVLLEELNISKEDRAIVLKSMDEINRIKSLLKSLLDFAKPPKLQLTTVNLNDLLDQTMILFFYHPALSSNLSMKIDVLKDFDENIPAMLADPLQLKKAFLNLMCNAMEAMPDGGTIRVTSAYNKNTNSIIIEFSDTGTGIDKKIIDDIFKPFFTNKIKNTGLGLAISRRIVEEHGGSISVSSNPGSRTTFCVSLSPITESGT